MKITLSHYASCYGVPVILDDDGKVMDYGPGVKAVRQEIGWSRPIFAGMCNVSIRTVEAWETRKPIPASALNVLKVGLKKSGL